MNEEFVKHWEGLSYSAKITAIIDTLTKVSDNYEVYAQRRDAEWASKPYFDSVKLLKFMVDYL